MNERSNSSDFSLQLPERTVAQLNELIRAGRFSNHQTAVSVAVERLYAEEHARLTARQKAFTRLCGALQLGTTRESLRVAELDRLGGEEPKQ